VFAPDVTDTMYDMFLSRLRYQINSINSQEDRGYRLSISVGSALYDPDSPCSVDVLISEAGKLMKDDKILEHKRYQ
jgi:hypothetical protein